MSETKPAQVNRLTHAEHTAIREDAEQRWLKATTEAIGAAELAGHDPAQVANSMADIASRWGARMRASAEFKSEGMKDRRQKESKPERDTGLVTYRTVDEREPAESIQEALDSVVEWEGCHAAKDGQCSWSGCPQLRDGEPARSGRHCPRDVLEEYE